MARRAATPVPPRLARYRAKRDFEVTPEPAGGRRAGGRRAGPRFVVQKHAARRLHYDFRLEHGGVLLSWAVPKGPSEVPGDKRLAVRTEDHPLSYADFQGRIPAGEYGAGKVEIWDLGVWQPPADVERALAKGHLDFRLEGRKLRGGWHLVRMGGGRRDPGEKADWLLIKGSDAPPRRQRTATPAPRAASRARRPAAPLELQLATLVEKPPAGDAWLHEIKWDGYRLLLVRRGARVRALTRGGEDWSDRFPALVRAAGALPADDLVLDGEAVVLLRGGRSDFHSLQRALSTGRAGDVAFAAFDLLELNGEDLRGLALETRKERLRELLADGPGAGPLLFSPHQVGRGDERLAGACKAGLEGIVSKRRGEPYRPGRGRDWRKSKCRRRHEFVVAGYTYGSSGTRTLGALELGVYDADGHLVRAGRVGTGFGAAEGAELLARLRPLAAAASPFDDGSRPPRGVHWVQPRLVAEVEFTEWTADGKLRHPSFQGLREDKEAATVMREEPQAPVRKRAASGSGEAKARAGGGARTAAAAAARVAGVGITHPDRLVIARSRVTKLELARYFVDVWEHMAPHLRGRPVALVRCPGGAGTKCFFQKHFEDELAGIRKVDLSPPGERDEPYPVIVSRRGLVELAQRSTVEIHLWGARADAVERPDRLVIDLDPGSGVSWRRLAKAARLVRSLLAELGLESWPMATGGKGLHVVAPLVRRRDWAEVKGFAAAVARLIVRVDPRSFTAKATKSERAGRVFVDYLRNGRGATAIAPYCPRTRPGAPVAVPLDWPEIDARQVFDVETVRQRLSSRRRDPWQGYFEQAQSITTAALRRLDLAAGG